MSFTPVKKLLDHQQGKKARWFSYIGLWTGVVLLLAALQLFINFKALLQESDTVNSEGNDFISISKEITNSNMGRLDETTFSEEEINAFKQLSTVVDASPLISNQFRVQLSAAGMIGFRTDFFLESIEKSYLENTPEAFQWSEGQDFIPLIISNDFLELYNVFAPSYGLPQFSKETLYNIPLNIICYDSWGRSQTFMGKIVGTTSRVNSILAPVEFIHWANSKFSEPAPIASSRVYLELKDMNDPAFLSFLDQHGYSINQNKVQLGKVKQILNGISGGLAFFGILITGLAMLVFSFYLQLMLAKSRHSLELLITIGYAPGWMSKQLSKQYLPLYTIIVVSAVAVTQILQYIFVQTIPLIQHDLNGWIHWSVGLLAILLLTLIYRINHGTMKKILYGFSR